MPGAEARGPPCGRRSQAVRCTARGTSTMNAARWTILPSLAICWAISASPGHAQDAEKAYYAGKTVRMVVGSGVGGGYDIFSRLIAPYLAKVLGATVIV